MSNAISQWITKCPTLKARGYTPRFASRKSTRSAALQSGNALSTLHAARALLIETNQYGDRKPTQETFSILTRRNGVVVRRKDYP